MMAATLGAVLLSFQLTAQTVETADSLLVAADTSSLATLEDRARRDQAAFREAVQRALRQSTIGADPERMLLVAGKLADAHAEAWDDPFLPAQVVRFASASIEWRREKFRADSLRRTASETFADAGARAALPLWREGLRIATALADTAGMAAVLYNIGASVFLGENALDSAEAYLLRSRRLAISAGDRVMEGNALGALHFVSLDRGDLLAAEGRLSEAMALRERTGDARGAAADLNSRGLLAWDLGDLAGARRDFESALAMNRRADRMEAAATNLTNLAALASAEGDFARALALYGEALSTYRTRGMQADAARVLWGLGQLELRRGDYPRARSGLAEAVAIYSLTGPIVDEVGARRDLAAAMGAMGEIQAANDELHRAELVADDAEGLSVVVRAGLALARGDLWLLLNAHDEAERAFGLAERLYAEVSDAPGQAEARQGQGLLLLEEEAFERAEVVLGGALRAQQAAGNLRGAALTKVFLAEAIGGQGDVEGARSLLREAIEELRRLSDRVAEAFAWAELAGLETGEGHPLSADSLYVVAVRTLGDRAAPEVRWRLHLGRGLAARRLQSLDAAARELRLATEQVELAAGSLTLAERRSAYRADKSEAYAQLALTEWMRGRNVAAFEASERIRAREALETLSWGRPSPPAGIAGALATREHDLRTRIAELTRELEPADPARMALRGPDPAAASRGASLEALSRARDDYAELLLEIRERAPRQADLVEPEIAGWRDVARRLSPGTVLIEYLLTDSGSVAFVVRPDTLTAVDLGISRRDLARLVEFTRGMLDGPVRSADAQWRASLRRLHEHLIAPAQDARLLDGVERIIFVPHRELHYLPFAALLDSRNRFLIEAYAVGYAPSASTWLTLGDRPRRSPSRGVLALAPRTESLPGTGREVGSMARLEGDEVSVLRDGQATEERFLRDAGLYRVLHLATYGSLNKHNPLFSFVDLAPGPGADGRLEVHEVLGLDLAADLVVLSACQTALGSGAAADIPEGDDWVGLTRAFLYAGAQRVVATLWAVEDQSIADVMERFHANRHAGLDDMNALAEAQRRLLADPETAHPVHWAAAVLVGQQEVVDAR